MFLLYLQIKKSRTMNIYQILTFPRDAWRYIFIEPRDVPPSQRRGHIIKVMLTSEQAKSDCLMCVTLAPSPPSSRLNPIGPPVQLNGCMKMVTHVDYPDWCHACVRVCCIILQPLFPQSILSEVINVGMESSSVHRHMLRE